MTVLFHFPHVGATFYFGSRFCHHGIPLSDSLSHGTGFALKIIAEVEPFGEVSNGGLERPGINPPAPSRGASVPYGHRLCFLERFFGFGTTAVPCENRVIRRRWGLPKFGTCGNLWITEIAGGHRNGIFYSGIISPESLGRRQPGGSNAG